MYANRFGLTEDPFRVTPDRRYLFFGEVHGPVISKLRSTMVRPQGVCLLTGAPGVGKTLALQQAAGMLPDGTPVSLIYNAHLDFRGFLDAVLAGFGVETRGDADTADLLEQLSAFVDHCLVRGRYPVIVVDEAGHLSAEVVNRLGELAGHCRREVQGISVILGSDLAHREALRTQLDGVTGFTEISVDALGPREIPEYMEHRLRLAGWRDGALFYDSAIERIAEVSAGVPRIINMLAGKALFLTHLGGGQTVSRASVDEAALELWSMGGAPSTGGQGTSLFAERLEAPRLEATLPEKSPVPGRREPNLTAAVTASDALASDLPHPPVNPRVASAGSTRPAPVRASPVRRFAFLAVLVFALVGLVAKMSSEEGQDAVMETAQAIIENVNKVAQDIRRWVVAKEMASEPRAARVDWTPPPRPVAVSMGTSTGSAGAVSKQ